MKANRSCYVYLYDQYSDWEPALAMNGLNSLTDISVITFSLNGQRVTSGGNLAIQPQQSLAQAMEADIDLLIIPGGATIASDAVHEAILPLVNKQLAAGKILAAICDATAFLGQRGYLDHIKHTGNHPELLKMMAPNYKGAALYANVPATTGANVITASGTAMAEFTREIYAALELEGNKELNQALSYFLHTSPSPDISTIQPLHFFYRSYQIKMADMMALVRTATKEIYEQAIATGLEVCGTIQWHYHHFDGNPDTVFRLDIGLPVTATSQVPAPYHCQTLPAFDCVSMIHPGSWDKLGDTYGQLIGGINALGIQMSGYNREQYLQYNFDQPAQNITNVQIGIVKP